MIGEGTCGNINKKLYFFVFLWSFGRRSEGERKRGGKKRKKKREEGGGTLTPQRPLCSFAGEPLAHLQELFNSETQWRAKLVAQLNQLAMTQIIVGGAL